jgi:hypothetical protein
LKLPVSVSWIVNGRGCNRPGAGNLYYLDCSD